MKAIIENGKTYKVVSERGAFTVCEDSKGKCKMFETSKIEVVEISEMPKEKAYNNKSQKSVVCDGTNKFNDRLKAAYESETGRTGLSLDELKRI